MIRIKFFILSTLIFGDISTLLGQFTLSGKITSQLNNEAIQNAEIFHHESGTILLSNKIGQYKFDNISNGKQTITVFALGYSTVTDTVLVRANSVYDFKLSKLSHSISNVEIAAKKQELFGIKQLNDIEGTSIFAGKKTEVVILDLTKGNLSSNNGRQVYAQVAGLNIYEGNDGGLQLNLGGRGLDPNRTSNFNTRQNGYDISADVLGYPENYYTPPSEAISEIRILRGASSLQYGTQFGGLIDFKLRKIPSFKKIEVITNQTYGSFNAFNSFNSIGINKGKLSIQSFYNYKRGDGYRPHSNYVSHNAFFATEYKFSKQAKLGFEYTYFRYLAKQAGGLTDEQFAENPRLSTRDRNWFAVDWNLVNLYYKQTFKNQSKLSVSAFGLNASRKSVGFRGNPINLNENPITAIDEKDYNENYIQPRDLIKGKFRNHGIEVRYLSNYTLKSKKSVLLLGSKYYKSNNLSQQGPGSNGADADFNFYQSEFSDYPSQSDFVFPNLNLAFFAENIFYLSDKLSVTPGLRIEHIKTEAIGSYSQVVFDNAGNAIANNLLEDNQLLRRNFALLGIGISYKKSKALQFIANLSQNYRSVTFSDIRVVSPTFIVDPGIKDERGITADLGIKGIKGKYLSYDLTTFGVLYNDRIGIILDNRANRVRANIGTAIIAGIESLFNFNVTKFINPNEEDFLIRYFINSAFTFSEYLTSKENNVVGKKVEFIPMINLKQGFSFGYKNFEVTLQHTYLSEQFTDVQNSRIPAEGDLRSGVIGEIPSYQVFDLTAEIIFNKFKISTGINNLLNRSYFTRRATGYPGPGIIPSDGRSFFVTASFKI